MYVCVYICLRTYMHGYIVIYGCINKYTVDTYLRFCVENVRK